MSVLALDRPMRGVLRRVRKLAYSAARGTHAPAGWLGYRSVRPIALEAAASQVRLLLPASLARAPPPQNTALQALSRERGWWGYARRDVPHRFLEPVLSARLRDALIAGYRDSEGQFRPAVMTAAGRALDLPELTFRPEHAAQLRSHGRGRCLGRAVWLLERVYENHAHWLLHHAPKLALLAQHGASAPPLLLPRALPTVQARTLELFGFDPADQLGFEPEDLPLAVTELEVFSIGRLRPELLQATRAALAPPSAKPRRRRLYVSRARARGRRYLPERDILPLLERYGFERVFAEDLTLDEEIALFREAEAVAGPVGAGLANTLFCAPGAHVLEICDRSFPTPEFYALSSALNLHHWIVEAEGVGEGKPLLRDLEGGETALAAALARIDRGV